MIKALGFYVLACILKGFCYLGESCPEHSNCMGRCPKMTNFSKGHVCVSTPSHAIYQDHFCYINIRTSRTTSIRDGLRFKLSVI